MCHRRGLCWERADRPTATITELKKYYPLINVSSV